MADDKAAKRYSKPSEAKEEKTEPATERKAEAAGTKPEGGAEDRMGAMRKRHEAEMRDLHNNHRTAMRGMFDRHASEYAGMGDADPAAAGNAGAPA